MGNNFQLWVIILMIIISSGVKASMVHQLNSTDFNSLVLNSGGNFLIEFFTLRCDYCKTSTSVWEKTATVLESIVSVAALDVDAHKSLGEEYLIKEFPSIKLFVPGKSPADYHNAREVVPIVVFAYQQIKALVKDRLNELPMFTPVELNSSNFDDLVIESNKLWCVGFFSPRRKYDKSLAHEWRKAARYLKGKVMSGHVNCDEDNSLMDRLRVQTCPTIMIFGVVPIRLEGSKTAQGIETFAINQWQTWRQLQTNETGEVTELTGPEDCGSVVICFIAILPDILYPKSRNWVLETLLPVAEKFKRSPYKFVWTVHGKQPGLQKSIHRRSHVPFELVAAVNAKKGIYAIHEDGFRTEDIVNFASMVQQGKKTFTALKTTPVIVESEAVEFEADEFSQKEQASSIKDEL